MRALVWARVPAWACRLGVPGFHKGGFSWGGWIFGKRITVCYHLLKINTEQLPITPQSHQARGRRTETLGGKLKGRLRLDDPCGCGLASPGQPIDRAASLPRVHRLALLGPRPWAGPSGSHRSLPGGRSCVLSHGRACPRGLAA